MFTSNQLTIDRSKWLPYGLAIVACIIALRQPAEVEKIQTKVVTKTVDRVVYKDRIKVVRKVVTKPDGTKIETDTRDETKSGSSTKKRSKEKDKSSIISRSLPNYSLSVHCDIRNCSSYGSYQVIAGFRLGDLPLNLEVGGGISTILIGVRYDF